MDTSYFTCITPEVRRLVSFHRTPLPNHHKMSISNSPAKLAKAGFQRRADAFKDEVCCESCGIVYGDWAGESPFAVHRVLNEKCPLLTNSSAANDVLQHPRVVSARRQLFPVDDLETNNRSDGDDRDDADPAGSENENSESEGDEFDHNRDEETENDDDAPNSQALVSSSPETDNNTTHGSNATQSAEPQPTFVSVMSAQASFAFPFEPPVGGFSLLFASRRLKTFADMGCPECIEWAEEGFVFRSATRDVQCVFCAITLPFHICEPKQAHVEKSASCPRVLLFDVGNISTAEEEHIKLKNLQRQLKTKSSPDRHYTICYPQYEEESVRLGTYDNWPYSCWDDHLHPSLMSQAGFYFTGCADKVKCYSCGVGVYRWRQGSDPWEQHARHMPTCPHLATKGQHFVQQAAHAQVLTEVDLPTTASNTASPDWGSEVTGEVWRSAPGSLTLDVCAVTAALTTSQYTPQQVRHAVLTFFSHTSRYPTKDILLGTLKAADDNFTTVCQQRETIHQKDTALQQKDTALQQKDTVIQQTHTQLQQQGTQLQQQGTVVEHQNQIIHQHQLELSVREEELQAKEEELQAKEEELQTNREELERRRRQMSHQESQIESLRIQMQALLAERRQAGPQAAPLQAPAAIPNGAPDSDDGGEGPLVCDIRCKVCLCAESNTILQPCHHITCCSRCAHQLFNNCCPVCRAPIRNVLPAYIS
ncbi:hypothetical protein ACOMHN_064769 [Nucella lapillus]